MTNCTLESDYEASKIAAGNYRIDGMIPEEKQKAYEYIEGTCNSVHSAINYLNLKCNIEQFRNAMLDFNIEECPTCGWWVECHERIPDTDYSDSETDTPDKYCENCRPSIDIYKKLHNK